MPRDVSLHGWCAAARGILKGGMTNLRTHKGKLASSRAQSCLEQENELTKFGISLLTRQQERGDRSWGDRRKRKTILETFIPEIGEVEGVFPMRYLMHQANLFSKQDREGGRGITG